MTARFLVPINLESDAEEETNCITNKSIFYLNSALVVAKASNLNNVRSFIDSNFNKSAMVVDARELQDVPDVIDLLNKGAAKIFVNREVSQSILNDNALEDLSRLVVGLDPSDPGLLDTIISKGPKLGGVIVDSILVKGLLENLKQNTAMGSGMRVYANLATWHEDTYDSWLHNEVIPIIPATLLTADQSRFPSKVPVHTLFLHGVKSDRDDKLLPSIVLDESGTSLGLVYSSAASVAEAIKLGRGVYQSRKRPGLWIKGDTSGDVQELLRVGIDCDWDTLVFTVRQKGDGFCHMKTDTCFGSYSGLAKLQKTLEDRARTAPPGSYTAKMFSNPKQLQAKIMEEADELCKAETPGDVAAEAADLMYFALTKCVASGVSIEEVQKNLDLKSLRVSRRKGDAKPEWAQKVGLANGSTTVTKSSKTKEEIKEAAGVSKSKNDEPSAGGGQIRMKRFSTTEVNAAELEEILQRPSQRSSERIMAIVKDILDKVRVGGDTAMLEYMRTLDQVTGVSTPILRAPFPEHLMQLDPETKSAIDVAFANIYKFHKSQEDKLPLEVETMEGVACSRFVRPIERVGLYVPGGTAVLPSTALMLGVPAMIAGCKTITIACRPQSDGTPTPEVVYIAHKVKAGSIVLAGGAQAIAGMAFGTKSIPKVEKILGPGNQFVTMAKMLVSNDSTANVAIDMPAGPSEVLVIADKSAVPAFVAADLLSQAEHGPDSQVVLIAVGLDQGQLAAIEQELHSQAYALPRVDIVRGAIDHSVTLVVQSVEEAMEWSNKYAPEHLILQIEQAEEAVKLVTNAGSVFIGPWTPESVGDYAAGVNHSLPTSGYAKQYSGVSLASFTKNITSTRLSKDGLRNLSPAVTQLARVEGLEAHRRAVTIRMDRLDKV